jgi:DNA-binding response OmpR family regulator
MAASSSPEWYGGLQRGSALSTVFCVMNEGSTRAAIEETLKVIRTECRFCTFDQFTPVLCLEPDLSAVLMDASAEPQRAIQIVPQITAISQLPILVIIANGQDLELIRLLDLGVSDFVLSPLHRDEFILRLQVLWLRNTQIQAKTGQTMLRCQDLFLDIKEHRAWKEGKRIFISPTGFSLLTYLMRHQGQLVTRAQLLQGVWGYTHPVENANLVEIGIARLRKELGEDPKHPAYLHTIWGQGYRFEYQEQGQFSETPAG